LRIVCVTPWFPNTPGDPYYNYIYRSVEAQQARGCAVTVLVTRPWTPRVFGLLHSDWIRPPLQVSQFDSKLQITVCHYPSIPRDLSPELNGLLYRISCRAFLRGLVRANKPDVIHAHTEPTGNLAVAVGREFNVPVVVTLHGINTSPRQLSTEARRASLRAMLLAADKVVLVGEPLRAHFGAITGSEKNFRVVPNGFYLPKPARQPAPGKWGERVRFISVSNLHEGKGIDLTLQALALLEKEGYVNWTYRIVGSGEQRALLEGLVRALRLSGKVEFTGLLAHERALAMLQEADVFVLPSYREAFGVAYLEAMGTGLLTIGVEGQGPASFIKHGQTGLLVQPRSVDSLVSKLRLVLREKEQMLGIAEEGWRLALREYTWDRHAEKLIATYGEISQERNRGAGN